jgi:tellurite resistance protein TehA-like permease
VSFFVIFTTISFLRYALYPKLWGAMLRHPHQSLFTGTFPIGLGTIVVMVSLVCVPAWGEAMATLAWVLWWIDCVIAVAVCLHMTFTVLV